MQRTMLQLFQSAAHGTLFTTHALLKTATPFLRHWGMPPKGRTVFRREARYAFLLKTFFSPKSFRELSLETKARYPEAEARESLRVERREICAPCALARPP